VRAAPLGGFPSESFKRPFKLEDTRSFVVAAL
jgi:hypothetical protein